MFFEYLRVIEAKYLILFMLGRLLNARARFHAMAADASIPLNSISLSESSSSEAGQSRIVALDEQQLDSEQDLFIHGEEKRCGYERGGCS